MYGDSSMADHNASISALVALAPISLTSYRDLRYDGGSMGGGLEAFPAHDQALLQEIYSALGATFALLRANEQQPDPTVVDRLSQLYDERWHDLIGRMQAFGATLEAPTQRLRQIAHDLKGGAFQALTMHLQLLKLALVGVDELHRMFFLARDQLKIMRNALPAIDPVATERDTQQQLHAVELIVEKWQQSRHRFGEHEAIVTVDCHYSGSIAERCLEFSAVDRVLYNLINNATTHTSDGRVGLTILAIPDDQPQHLRLIVSNQVSAAQRRRLEHRFPEGPGALFKGGYTTGGSGLGMRICADFICNAYGLSSVEQGLAEGHFGARFLDEQLHIWVHWPIAAD